MSFSAFRLPLHLIAANVRLQLPLFALGTFLGLVPYDCAAIYFGTTISDISKVKEITQEPATIAVTIVGFTLSVTMLCFIGRLAKRKMDELTQPVSSPAFTSAKCTDIVAGLMSYSCFLLL